MSVFVCMKCADVFIFRSLCMCFSMVYTLHARIDRYRQLCRMPFLSIMLYISFYSRLLFLVGQIFVVVVLLIRITEMCNLKKKKKFKIEIIQNNPEKTEQTLP